MTRFGYNVLGDFESINDHLSKINPGAMVYFQNQIDQAIAVAQRFPDAHIIVRFWPDSETYKKYPNPADWVYAHRDLIGTGLIVQTTNESGFTAEVILWHERLLAYLINTKTNLRVGILGLNVGTPTPEEWVQADNLFRLAARLPGQVYLLLHEYFGAVVTSGMIGGDPNNAGVSHGQPGGTNLIPMDKWPKDPRSLTLWHVGRYMFLKRHLASVGIALPPIIISEFGADYLGDLDAFMKSLHSTQGQYDSVDGWRDLWNDWRDWYGLEPADVYMKMAAYADQNIYDDSVVGICFFAWGDDGHWRQYQTNPELSKQLETYAKVEHPPVVNPPTEEPPAHVVKDRSGELMAYIKSALDKWK